MVKGVNLLHTWPVCWSSQQDYLALLGPELLTTHGQGVRDPDSMHTSALREQSRALILDAEIYLCQRQAVQLLLKMRLG